MPEYTEYKALWEYRFLYLEREYEATCNRWGREGWEAVAYTGKSILFKRPLLIDGPTDA